MEHSFDQDYWERHWHDRAALGVGREMTVNDHLVREVHDLEPGTALDAGCGEGAEAIWLAGAGWQVTAVDISSEALRRASLQAISRHTHPPAIEWVEADLDAWTPDDRFDLVTTHYAHPEGPQLEFYERIADWVTPGGTLLIVGHLHTEHHHHGDAHERRDRGARPPEQATVTAAAVSEVLDPNEWDIVTADELTRIVNVPAGKTVQLDDVVMRATRRY